MPLVLNGATSGSTTIQATDAVTATLTLPSSTGTLISTSSSGQVIPSGALPAGTVLQVVQVTKTNIFTSSAITFTDITGMSASITPKFSSSKILVTVNLSAGIETGGDGFATLLLRDGSSIYVGDANGSNFRASAATGRIAGGGSIGQTTLVYLDSPSTTSSVTYKVQARNDASGGTWKVNVNNDNNSADSAKPTAASSITLMEISA